jgi:hypothetical protein
VIFPADPPPVDVQRELAAMRAELAAIRAQAQDGWMDGERARQVRAVVEDALADSATRASMGDAGWTVSYDSGATIRSGDGALSANFTVLEQVRFVYSSAYGPADGSGDSNTRWGLENRRTNLTMQGHLVDPSITYLALLSYQSQADRFVQVPDTLRPMYAQLAKDLGDGWRTVVGLQNVPWDLESDFFGSSRLTTGDYSVFNYRFGAGKQPGVTLGRQGESARFSAGTFSQINVRADGGWNSDEYLSFAVAGRGELKFGGEWQQLSWMSGTPRDEPAVVLGLGGCMSNGRAQNPQPPGSLATPSAQGLTADVRASLRGTTLIAQYAWMRDPVGAPELGWYHGLNLQASAFVAGGVEAFAQASWMGDVPVEWIAQAGANLFLAGTHVKLTLKVIVPFGGGDVNGIREISGGLGIAAADNNASFVSQLQLMY